MSSHQQVASVPESRNLPAKASSHIQFAMWWSAMITVALTLRLVTLGVRSFWLDEAASSMLARVDWRTFVSALIHRQGNMTLYYFVLRGWTRFGNSETWTRFLSVIFGLASIPLMYWLGKVMLDRKTGRIAALLLATNAFHIEYSQQARGYSLVVFLALLSSYFFLRARKSKARGPWVAYAISSILLVYAQIFGVWLLLSQWFYGLSPQNPREIKKKILITGVTVAAFLSPLAFALLWKSDRSQLAWMNQSSAGSVYRLFLDFSGNGGIVLLTLDLALLVFSAVLHFRERRSKPPVNNSGYAFLWLWVLLPVLIVGSISVRWPILQARYLIACLPAFILLVAIGIKSIRWRVPFLTVLMAVAGLSLMGTSSYLYRRTELSYSDNWRDATRYVLSEVQLGDVVLFPYSAEEIAFREYQYRFAGSSEGVTLVPLKTDLELLSTAGRWTSPELVSSAASLHPRVWVISALQANSHSRAAQAAIESHLKQVSQRSFGFITVQVFTATNADVR